MPFAQGPRIFWFLIIELVLIVFSVDFVNAKIDGPPARPPLSASAIKTSVVEGSGVPPRIGGSIDDEVVRASGKSNNPDDEDDGPEVGGSGALPPPVQIQPAVQRTTSTTTAAPTRPFELNLDEQEDDDDEDDDEEDDDDDDDLDTPDENLAPVLRPSETSTSTISSTASTLITRSQPPSVAQPAPTTTWRPPVPTTRRPPFVAVQEESVGLDMLKPGLLAAISGGAVVGLLLTILLVMFVVYRMRKKDEGSYALDEGAHQPASYSYAYQKAPTKEFYA